MRDKNARRPTIGHRVVRPRHPSRVQAKSNLQPSCVRYPYHNPFWLLAVQRGPLVVLYNIFSLSECIDIGRDSNLCLFGFSEGVLLMKPETDGQNC